MYLIFLDPGFFGIDIGNMTAKHVYTGVTKQVFRTPVPAGNITLQVSGYDRVPDLCYHLSLEYEFLDVFPPTGYQALIISGKHTQFICGLRYESIEFVRVYVSFLVNPALQRHQRLVETVCKNNTAADSKKFQCQPSG